MEEPKFIAKVKLTRQGQLTLPQEARAKLNIAAESDLYWYELDGYLILTKEIDSPKELLRKLKRK